MPTCEVTRVGICFGMQGLEKWDRGRNDGLLQARVGKDKHLGSWDPDLGGQTDRKSFALERVRAIPFPILESPEAFQRLRHEEPR